VTIVNALALTDAARKHPGALRPLAVWVRLTEDARWSNARETKQVLPKTNVVKSGKRVVATFNLDSEYRLLTVISYPLQTVEVLELLTHGQEGKIKAKGRG
jgi:mRNA-degrading endonuclease HigB of HigAB toxin-antitoxin module